MFNVIWSTQLRRIFPKLRYGSRINPNSIQGSFDFNRQMHLSACKYHQRFQNITSLSGNSYQTLSIHIRSLTSMGSNFVRDPIAVVRDPKDNKIGKVNNAYTTDEVCRLIGHNDVITKFAINFNGYKIATITGFPEQTIRIWDAYSGKQLLNPPISYSSAPRDLTFNRQNSLIAACDDESFIQPYSFSRWNAINGQGLGAFCGHTYCVQTINFSYNGSYIASGSYDKTARIWDVYSSQQLHTLVGHDAAIISLAFSPDGKLLVTGSQDKTVRFWDTATGSCLPDKTISGESSFVYPLNLMFSPNGKYIAFSDSSSLKMYMYDIENTTVPYQIFKNQNSPASCLEFNLDGTILASADNSGFNGTIEFWDVKTGKSNTVVTGFDGAVSNIRFPTDAVLPKRERTN